MPDDLVSRRDVLARIAALAAVPLVRSRAMDDPLGGTIADYQAGRALGAWSAVSVTESALARCASTGRSLNAIDRLSGRAIADARASDARARAHGLRGPLDGVPVFAKAIYDMDGTPTTASSAEWAGRFPQTLRRDAVEIARLRTAGAIVLGKTVADDFAYRGNGTSSHSGQTRNPYDPTGIKTPGGSSAGSAVAVACGMAFAALGTDDGGSNRIPAQFTGVVGMKPTFGLVPRSGVIPTWPYLDTHGPLARFVADAALLLDAVAGPDASDALALRSGWPREAAASRTSMASLASLASLRDDALAGARLGLVETHVPRAQMSAESLAVFDRALADIGAAGAVVESFDAPVTRVTFRAQFADAARARGDVAPDPNSPPATANALLRYFERQTGDPALARRQVELGLAPYTAFYDVLPKSWAGMAAIIDAPYERDPAGVSFARSRERVVALLARAMTDRRLDAMVYPTMPFPAPRASDPWPDVRTPLGFGNWLGLPEVSVPSGIGADGMPAGNISFVGLPGSDLEILALAHAYERQSRRFVPPPR